MSTNRTVEIIDAEINAIKDRNPNWVADNVDKALITALTTEKNQLSTAPATQPAVFGLLSWFSFSVGLYRYQCVLKNGRLKKCFRAKVFQLAQQFRGHRTSGVNGIGVDGPDIVVDVCFKDEPGLLDFQGALINQCGRKRRLDDNDEPYSYSIINEVISRLYFYQNLVRILGNDYMHHHADNDDDANNSPLCDSEGD
eukprot:gene39734-53719_t